MTQPQIKLSLEEATTAFDVLDLLQERFPENPEIAANILRVILRGLEVEGEQV